MMDNILTQMIGYLVGGLKGIATGIGQGLGELAQSIFLTGSADSGFSLSVFGSLVCIFGGISLAFGLCRLVVNWVRSLGSSRL